MPYPRRIGRVGPPAVIMVRPAPRRLGPCWLLSAGLTLATVSAASPAEELVSVRQASMKLMASAAKTISEMFAGKAPFNADQFGKSITAIKEHSGRALVAQFPDGTFDGPSAATSRITAERERFDAVAMRLRSLVQVLDGRMASASAITDQMRMRNTLPSGGSLLGGRNDRHPEDLNELSAEHVFHLMLETCTSCHATFRAAKP